MRHLVRRRRTAGLALVPAVLLMAISGCKYGFGPTTETFRPAQSSFGVDATLRLEDAVVTGELLEVRDTALLVLVDSPPRVVLLPFPSIQAGSFDQTDLTLVRGGFRSDEDRDLARGLSRYPQGLQASQLQALLRVYDQREPEVIR